MFRYNDKTDSMINKDLTPLEKTQLFNIVVRTIINKTSNNLSKRQFESKKREFIKSHTFTGGVMYFELKFIVNGKYVDRAFLTKDRKIRIEYVPVEKVDFESKASRGYFSKESLRHTRL